MDFINKNRPMSVLHKKNHVITLKLFSHPLQKFIIAIVAMDGHEMVFGGQSPLKLKV